jgi:pimeloyl-ACP methyl ester carboxylesterase
MPKQFGRSWRQLDALLEAGDRDGVISTMMCELVRMPQEEVEYLRSLPAWQERVKAAHTVPRELHADEHYHFDAERFKGLGTPTLALEGSDSPAFLKAADKAVNETLPNCRIVVMPGQGHAAMDTGTDLFTLRLDGVIGSSPEVSADGIMVDCVTD